MAATIWRAVNQARQCSNFRDLFHMPVHLLATGGTALSESGMFAEADVLFEHALSEPERWARFKPQIVASRRALTLVKLQLAEVRLREACMPGIPPDAALHKRRRRGE